MKRLLPALFLAFCLWVPEQANAAGGAYLALGDSVPFGSNPLLDPSHATNFVGYPDLIAQQLGLTETNASCPGEPTGHFISASSDAFLCGAYRALFPLHTWYLGSQLDFANFWLFFNASQTRLITITLGLNDYYMLTAACWGNQTCIEQGLPQRTTAMRANLHTILTQLRKDGYHGRIVMFNHYLSDPANAQTSADIGTINNAIAAEAQTSGVDLADARAAFSAAGGSNPCAAGLLVVTSTNPLKCDIHPSLAGHRLLAGLVTK